MSDDEKKTDETADGLDELGLTDASAEAPGAEAATSAVPTVAVPTAAVPTVELPGAGPAQPSAGMPAGGVPTTGTPSGGMPASRGAQPTASLPTATLPPAEPAWVSGWTLNEPNRTTPRVRWAGVVWGLLFALAGGLALWTMTGAERRAGFSGWVLSLNDGGWVLLSALALGGLLLVIGLIAGLRAATRRR
ncbi:MAG TPA: hypothetical protein VGC45_00790 [Gryllotalpicola sp.]